MRTGARAAGLTECDVLQAALQQFYAERTAAPEVHIPMPLPAADAELLEGWLSGEAGRRVRLVVPKRGEKRGLLDLAARNAEVAYQARFNENVAANYDALETLRVVLGLRAVPRRIECFDISTIQGSETVASMVVCEDGRMKRSEYRKFRIRGNALARGSGVPRDSEARRGRPQPGGAPAACRRCAGRAARPAPGSRFLNDFAAMHEVVLRRYRKLLENGRAVSGSDPDRRRQRAVVVRLRGAAGARARESRRGRYREEGGAALHARSRGRDRAAARRVRRSC